jgi:hypothetical protein
MIQRAKEECPHDFFLEIFSIAAWAIWKQRNDKIFTAQTPSITSWKEIFSLIVNQQLYRRSEVDKAFGPSLVVFSFFIPFLSFGFWVPPYNCSLSFF